MEKSYQVSVNNKSVAVAAPVIAQIPFAESTPDPGWVSWLSQKETTREKGLALRRSGGIALIILGIPVGIFGLLCFPGLLFWILGPVGLLCVGKGILMMFSKRNKSPEDAFKNLFKQAFFDADSPTVSFTPQLFKPIEGINKRILDMCPIEGIDIKDGDLIRFMNAFEGAIRAAFGQYGGADSPDALYGVFMDQTVETVSRQNNLTTVRGTINIVRQSGGISQIIEAPVSISVIDLGGYQMPTNLVPRLSVAPTYQDPAMGNQAAALA